jgi:hypothetical protein
MWSRLPASAHRATERTRERTAHVHGRASLTACEVETQAESFSSTAITPAHAAIARCWLPHHGGVNVACSGRRRGQYASHLGGKSRKQRIIPFFVGLRKALHRFIADFERKPDYLLVATREHSASPYDRT